MQTSYKIEPHGGQYVLYRMTPVLVGTFPDILTAATVRQLLEGADKPKALPKPEMAEQEPVAEPTEADADEAAPEPNPAPEALEQEEVAPEPVAPPQAPEPAEVAETAPTADKPVAEAETDESEWTEAELQAAFTCLKKGQKLQEVAAEAGRSWTVLRGKWAAHKRIEAHKAAEAMTMPVTSVEVAPVAQLPARQEDFIHPVVKVSRAIEELKDQPACKLCGRHFTMRPDQLDLCSRCS